MSLHVQCLKDVIFWNHQVMMKMITTVNGRIEGMNQDIEDNYNGQTYFCWWFLYISLK